MPIKAKEWIWGKGIEGYDTRSLLFPLILNSCWPVGKFYKPWRLSLIPNTLSWVSVETLIRDAIVAIVQTGQAAGRAHRGPGEHREGDFRKEPFVAQKESGCPPGCPHHLRVLCRANTWWRPKTVFDIWWSHPQPRFHGRCAWESVGKNM